MVHKLLREALFTSLWPTKSNMRDVRPSEILAIFRVGIRTRDGAYVNPETRPNLCAEKSWIRLRQLLRFLECQKVRVPFLIKKCTFYGKNTALCYLRKRRKSTKIRACEHWGIGRKLSVSINTRHCNVRCVIQGLVRLDEVSFAPPACGMLSSTKVWSGLG